MRVALITALAAATLALGACAPHGPGGVAYESGDQTRATGSTSGGAGGVVSGGTSSAPSGEKKPERGNTPPGVDRDGHGPAAGAIVDPAGVVTGHKP